MSNHNLIDTNIEGSFSVDPPLFLKLDTYNSFEEAFEKAKKHLATVFVEAVISSSTTNKEENIRTYGKIQCHRYGNPPEHGNAPRILNRDSGKCNCPFLWTIHSKKNKLGGGGFVRVFHIKPRNNEHNHRTNDTIFKSIAHQRQLTEEQFKTVKRLIEDGVPVTDIVTCLREKYPQQVFTNRTVYDVTQRIREGI